MIKQTFLDSLKGVNLTVAQAKVLAAGHQVELVPEEAMAITLQARPNTVILWQKNGKVSFAEAGDGLELDQDI